MNIMENNMNELDLLKQLLNEYSDNIEHLIKILKIFVGNNTSSQTVSS